MHKGKYHNTVVGGVGGRGLGVHCLVAERALGKRLPKGAIVHHVDHDRSNNKPTNLVICPNQAYHLLLHQRERALMACGNPDWRHCGLCKQYDAPENMQRTSQNAYRHARCYNAYMRKWRAS
jgi:hypothetical protein